MKRKISVYKYKLRKKDKKDLLDVSNFKLFPDSIISFLNGKKSGIGKFNDNEDFYLEHIDNENSDNIRLIFGKLSSSENIAKINERNLNIKKIKLGGEEKFITYMHMVISTKFPYVAIERRKTPSVNQLGLFISKKATTFDLVDFLPKYKREYIEELLKKNKITRFSFLLSLYGKVPQKTFGILDSKLLTSENDIQNIKISVSIKKVKNKKNAGSKLGNNTVVSSIEELFLEDLISKKQVELESNGEKVNIDLKNYSLQEEMSFSDNGNGIINNEIFDFLEEKVNSCEEFG